MLQHSQHLKRQYADRMTYWRSRAQSRLRSVNASGFETVCLIIDAMDKSKFRFPRTLLMQSKDLEGLQRPSLEMTACIAHGRCLVLAVGGPRIHKDSSAMCDIVLHTLNRLACSGLDLRRCELVLQTDNTSRESKNNCMLRLMGSLVASRRVGRCELRCLQSGHSHEDIDGFFSIVASSLEQENELLLPIDYINKLERFLRQPQAGGVFSSIFSACRTLTDSIIEFNNPLPASRLNPFGFMLPVAL